MRAKTPATLISLLVLTISAAAPAAEAAKVKKLIEFGWDEPNTTFMKDHAAQMDKTPFDGCIFHLDYVDKAGQNGQFTWYSWGKRAFTDAELRKAAADLKAATGKFTRLTDNFLRFNTTPAD